MINPGNRVRRTAAEAAVSAVSEPRIRLEIDVFNTMTGSSREPVLLEGTLSGFINNPRELLFSFLTRFLRYTVHRATITADPPDALIFVDDELIRSGDSSLLRGTQCRQTA